METKVVTQNEKNGEMIEQIEEAVSQGEPQMPWEFLGKGLRRLSGEQSGEFP